MSARGPELLGFPRASGAWGVRDHVLVLPIEVTAAGVAREIAERVPGAVAATHEWERVAEDPDTARLEETLVSVAAHPNVGAVLLVGIDGEERLADAVARRGQHVGLVHLTDHGGHRGTVEAGVARLTGLAATRPRAERQPMPWAALSVGLECGGSDGFSGVSANPALGSAMDELVRRGGAAILAEVPELIGAEPLLARRAVSEDVAERLWRVVGAFEDEIVRFGVDIRGSQPSPGNIAGGITTLEEKSLGAVTKGGSSPLVDVLDYGRPARGGGLHVMDTTGHDIEQMVGLVAGGSQIVAFTTGRGTPTGSPIAPCLKIASNSTLFERQRGDLDLNAGTVVDGTEDVDGVGVRILAALAAAASGEPTAAERNRNHDFALSRETFGSLAGR